jgi:hypothetical protein
MAAYLLFRDRELVDDDAGVAQQDLPGFRRHDPLRAAKKKGCPEIRLHVAYMQAQRRLGDIEGAGRL